MKKYFINSVLSILVAFQALTAAAQLRSNDNIRLIAEDALQSEEPVLVLQEKAFNIFNNANDKGFVIVSSDERMPRVLGFSDTGTFDPANIPPAMRWMLNLNNSQLEAIESGIELKELHFPMATRAGGYEDVAPLLGDIMWDQDYPYNELCPTIYGEKAPSGCVATAMAQVMAYHKYPSTGSGQHSYTTGTNHINLSYDFSEANFNWDRIYPEYAKARMVTDQEASEEISDFLLNVDLKPIAGGLTISFEIDTILNNAQEEFVGAFGLMVYTSEGQFCGIGNFANIPSGTGFTFKKYLRTWDFDLSLPVDFPDGDYIIQFGIMPEGTSQWTRCKSANKHFFVRDPKTVTITKTGNTITCGQYTGTTLISDDDVHEIANLLYACGVAIDMDYKFDGSGAYTHDVGVALNKYFGYDNNIADIYEIGYDAMAGYAIEELLANRPIITGGYDTETKSGHCFVVDGFKRYAASDEPYFHINWGWSGTSNGYFPISNFSPAIASTGGISNSNYSAADFTMLLNVAPEDNIDIGLAVSVQALECDKSSITVGESVNINVTWITNTSITNWPAKEHIGVVLEDEDGNNYYAGDFISFNDELKTRYGTSKHENNIIIPDNIPTGDYIVKLGFRDRKNFGRYYGSRATHLYVNNPNPTAISTVLEDPETISNPEVFDLNGRKIQKANKGFFIDGKTIKYKN